MLDSRERIAEMMLESGALRVQPGADIPLIWDEEAALRNEKLVSALTEALAELIRDHYTVADAVLGGVWAELTAGKLGLPYEPASPPERPVYVAALIAEADTALQRLLPIKERGGSPAAAVLYQDGNEKARVHMDKADVRCHWLTDMEAAAAAALQSGRLDFEDYCLLLPQE